MKWPERELDREADEKQSKDDTSREQKVCAADGIGELGHVEGASGEEEHQNADEHERAAEDGEYQELHRRVFALALGVAAPDGDKEEHRNQFKLPEEEEEQEVE